MPSGHQQVVPSGAQCAGDCRSIPQKGRMSDNMHGTPRDNGLSVLVTELILSAPETYRKRIWPTWVYLRFWIVYVAHGPPTSPLPCMAGGGPRNFRAIAPCGFQGRGIIYGRKHEAGTTDLRSQKKKLAQSRVSVRVCAIMQCSAIIQVCAKEFAQFFLDSQK